MKKSYIFAGIAIFLWSTLAVSSKLLLSSFSNFQLLSISSLFATFSLLLFNIFTGRIKEIKSYSFKDYIIITITGLPGIFLYHIFYFAGTDILPASQAFIINYLWPVMSIIFACIILKEKMTVKKVIAILLSFCGVIIVTGSGLLNFEKNMLTGAMFCILGAISYGLFTALSKKIDYDNSITMMITFAVTFVLTYLLMLIKGEVFIPSLSQLPGLAWSGIFTMAIPNTVWIFALDKGDTAKISNLAYITPFLSLVWTSLILKETLTFSCVAGLIVIIAGILIQLKENK